MIVITAKYKGRCPKCSKAINIGDNIVWYPEFKDAFHADCSNVFRSTPPRPDEHLIYDAYTSAWLPIDERNKLETLRMIAHQRNTVIDETRKANDSLQHLINLTVDKLKKRDRTIGGLELERKELLDSLENWKFVAGERWNKIKEFEADMGSSWEPIAYCGKCGQEMNPSPSGFCNECEGK